MGTATRRTSGVILRKITPGCPGCEFFRNGLKAARDPRSKDYDLSRATDLVVLLGRHLKAIECVVPSVRRAA